MKKYLPIENITYSSKLNVVEITSRLDEVIQAEKSFSFLGVFGNSSDSAYQGTFDGRIFEIKRAIRYRNSFLPIITGSIEKDFVGTVINVKMKLHVFVIVFMAVWLGGCAIASIAIIGSMLSNQSFEPVALMPLVMMLFGYAMVMGGFKYESIKSKKYFAQLFEAEMVNNLH